MGKISFAEKVKSIFSRSKIQDENFFEDLEDALIDGDY